MDHIIQILLLFIGLAIGVTASWLVLRATPMWERRSKLTKGNCYIIVEDRLPG